MYKKEKNIGGRADSCLLRPYKGKNCNQFPDALMEKYKQCTILIKAISPNNAMMQYFDNVLADAKKRRLKAKIKPYGAILLAFSLIIIGLAVAGIASLFE